MSTRKKPARKKAERKTPLDTAALVLANQKAMADELTALRREIASFSHQLMHAKRVIDGVKARDVAAEAALRHLEGRIDKLYERDELTVDTDSAAKLLRALVGS